MNCNVWNISKFVSFGRLYDLADNFVYFADSFSDVL